LSSHLFVSVFVLIFAERLRILTMTCNNGRHSKKVVIVNDLGLHARSAAQIAQCVKSAASTVWIISGGEKADASSIIDILALGCAKGSKIQIIVNDLSDVEILNNLVCMIENGFGE
jgi:phosphocarrier protein HPr